MKKQITLILLFVPFAFSGCDFLDKFDHFRAGNTFEKSFTVIVDGASNTFDGSAEFDATDDEMINKNIDRINDYKVNKISFKITSFSGSSTSVGSGQIIISSNGEIIGTPVSMSSTNFSQLANSGEEVIVDLSDDTILAIKNAYLSNQTITIEASGEVTEQPVTIEFTIYMSIEARVNL